METIKPLMNEEKRTESGRFVDQEERGISECPCLAGIVDDIVKEA